MTSVKYSDLYMAMDYVSSGAYSRFKDLLHDHGALEAWYKYEESATREALCAWAKEEGFVVELESGDNTK